MRFGSAVVAVGRVFFPSKLGYGFVVALFRAGGTVKLPTVARSGRPSYRDRRGPGEELTPAGSLVHRLARTRRSSRPSGASPERRFRLSPLGGLRGAPRPDPARIRTQPPLLSHDGARDARRRRFTTEDEPI